MISTAEEKNSKVYVFFTHFMQIYERYAPGIYTAQQFEIYTNVCFVYPRVFVCVTQRLLYAFRFICVCVVKLMFACLLVCSCCPLCPQTHHTLSKGWLWTNMHACGSVYACMWDSCVRTYMCVCVCLYACVCALVCLHASVILWVPSVCE